MRRASSGNRCARAGILQETGFATKPELAWAMIGRAVRAGVPFAWVAGDGVCGGNPRLRSWLEEQQMSYVLA
jgi:SRSO17 transposase